MYINLFLRLELNFKYYININIINLDLLADFYTNI
jgi:hypothetical protein